MAALANPKHELFAQHIAKGASGREAYIAAGYGARDAAADVSASRLIRQAKVAARVAGLQNKAAIKTGVTLESMIQLGLDIIADARTAQDYTAASSTYERLAKISGLWIDRAQSDTNMVQRIYSSTPLTEEEWAARLPH